MPQRLALASLGVGAIMGLLVLAAAAVGGNQRKLYHWLIGTGWGSVVTSLMLTDCLNGGRPGPISEAAIPLFFGGLALWPAVMVWGRRPWFWRWLGAQLVMLVNIGPAFMVAIVAALCIFQ